MEATFCNWVPGAWGMTCYWQPPNPPEIEDCEYYLMWQPYRLAYDEQKFGQLIDAFEKGDPRTFAPEVRRLLAEQMRHPQKPSRKTQHGDSYPYMMELMIELARNPEMSEYRAIQNLLNRHDKLKYDTVRTWWREWKIKQSQ